MSPAMASVLASTITIGNHWKPFGLNINMDDVLGALVAGVIVIGMGSYLAAKVTPGVPGRLQAIYESIIDAITRQASRSMGERARPIVPLVVTLFLYILIANWLEMIPTQPTDSGPQYLPAPTGDVNQTYALALLVIVGVHFAAVRTRGAKGYVKHYFKPYPALLPINVIEEIAKPVTLALRLFGNIFAGGLMLLLFAGLFSSYIVPLPDVIWKLFDGLFVGPIQAFIFSLLTLLYFETAMSHDH
jgi:F-type H+-transporting ATPase subunit a